MENDHNGDDGVNGGNQITFHQGRIPSREKSVEKGIQGGGSENNAEFQSCW